MPHFSPGVGHYLLERFWALSPHRRTGVPSFAFLAKGGIVKSRPSTSAFSPLGKSRCDNSHSMRGRFVLLFGVTSLAGCGYHTLGSAAHMPDTVHTLAVPIFKNKSQFYHTEVPMTQAVVHELTDRTRLHVTPASSEDVDATVSGTILSESVQPLTYRTQTTAATSGQLTSSTSSFLVTINVNVLVTGRDQRVLYQHNNYVFHEQFETTADVASFIQEDSPAVQRLSRDFAQALVSDILESF
jgi:outer membrane lipopolysaccharide assembly protein LptE/RlpB